MVRTRIYLTESQCAELAAIAVRTGRRRSEIIREAVDSLIERNRRDRHDAVLREASGIWRGRTDLPELDRLRREWDRD